MEGQYVQSLKGILNTLRVNGDRNERIVISLCTVRVHASLAAVFKSVLMAMSPYWG